MSMSANIKKLEERIFNLMVENSKEMLIMNKEKVRSVLITIKKLNEEYKEITKMDFVKKEYFDNEYSKLQREAKW